MLLVCPICAWSHLLHPVPELAQRLQPLTSRGQLQQGVAAHNQVILDSRNVLRRVYFKMYSYWVTLYCHRHLQSEWHGGRNPPARLGSIINDHPRNKTRTLCWAFHLWLLLPGQVIDMFWAINEESLWEVTKYFSARPQTGTHSGPKIKQSPGLKVPILLLDVLEDVDEAGELRRCPGHEVGEAPCLVKVNRSPLTSAIICSIDYRNRK